MLAYGIAYLITTLVPHQGFLSNVLDISCKYVRSLVEDNMIN